MSAEPVAPMGSECRNVMITFFAVVSDLLKNVFGAKCSLVSRDDKHGR